MTYTMNKLNTKYLFMAFAAIVWTTHLSAQVEYVSSNNMDFSDNSSRENYRTPEAGDVNIVVNSTINSSQFFDDQTADILNQDVDGTNRLAEQFVPSYRYYLSSRSCVSVGLLLSRENQLVTGTTLRIDTNEIRLLEQASTSRSLSFRLAYDRHNKPLRFKPFDLDTYFGAALSIGRTKATDRSDVEFVGGDRVYATVTTPGAAFGAELYTGIALRFDRMSIGLELLALGIDQQSGFGVSEVSFDQVVNGESESGSYLTSSGSLPSAFGGFEFSSLTASSARTSMYKGVRLSLVLHL